MTPTSRPDERAKRPDRDDWLRAARATLIRSGYSQIKIDHLARKLGVTRGGFYWRFKSRDELLASLLHDWEETNSSAILAALGQPGPPLDRFKALVQVWLAETDYSPAYDSAVRDWSRVSPMVAQAVARVDAKRIEAFRELFLDAGCAPDEALIRARVTYFHQVGYYAIGLRESRKTRDDYAALYRRILTGFPE